MCVVVVGGTLLTDICSWRALVPPRFRLILWLTRMGFRALPLCLVTPSSSPLCLISLSPWARPASCLLFLNPRDPPPVSRPQLCFGFSLRSLTNGHYGEARVVLAFYRVLIDHKENGTSAQVNPQGGSWGGNTLWSLLSPFTISCQRITLMEPKGSWSAAGLS